MESPATPNRPQGTLKTVERSSGNAYVSMETARGTCQPDHIFPARGPPKIDNVYVPSRAGGVIRRKSRGQVTEGSEGGGVVEEAPGWNPLSSLIVVGCPLDLGRPGFRSSGELRLLSVMGGLAVGLP